LPLVERLKYLIGTICILGSISASAQIESAPLLTDDTAVDYRYIQPLRIADIIFVDTHKVESMSKAYEIQASGEVDFPLIGPLHVEGQTPIELSQALMRIYEREEYLTRPFIRVGLIAPSPTSEVKDEAGLTYTPQDELSEIKDNSDVVDTGLIIVIDTLNDEQDIISDEITYEDTPLLKAILFRAPHTGILERD